MTFHHIGIACEDIDTTAALYAEAGYRIGEKIIDPLQNIEICFLDHDTMPRVELLGAVDENSPVVQILKKNGTTPYHTCYSVADISEGMRALRKKGYVVVSKPKTACAISGGKVAFLYHTAMGLIELVEIADN